jgi:hypothetical protein
MHEFNLSLITKLGWKLLSNTNCLWVNQLQKKYIKYENFISSPNPPSASWLWRGIQKIIPFISAATCLKVSTCSSSSVWFSNWVPSIPSFKPSPRYPSNRNMQSLQIRDLIDPVSVHWKAPAVNSLFDSALTQEILKTRIITAPDPTYLWTPSSTGRFSVSSAYEFITSSDTNPSLEPTQFWKSLWKLKLNDRLRLFLWKIAWNILPTQMRLGQIFLITSKTSCPLCNLPDDSLHHLFFDCFIARVVWLIHFGL